MKKKRTSNTGSVQLETICIIPYPSSPTPAPDRMLAVEEVAKLAGISRASIYRLERAGDFPKRKPLTAKRVGWRESEVAAWIARRGRPSTP